MNEEPEQKKSLRRSWKTSGPVAKFTVVFAGIAALATVTYAGITGWQLYLMRSQLKALLESNEINREALYSVQRAFVAAHKYTSELATYTDIDKTGKPVTVVETTAHWENIGNTPAIDVRMMFGSLQQKDDELSEEQFVGLNLISSASLTTSAIAPKVILDAGPIRQPEEWFFEKSDTPTHWFYWGWMLYKDIFPKTKTHVTEFCLRVNEIKWKVSSNGKPVGKPYFTATTCAQHNCMDDFCEDYATIIHAAPSK